MKSAFVLLAMFATQANSQSFNIDFGLGDGTPSPEYSGAGSAGFWNGVDVEASTQHQLFDIQGNATPSTIETTDVEFDVDTVRWPFNTPVAPESLFGDYAAGRSDSGSLTFSALENGTYEVIVYITGRQDFPQPSDVTIEHITMSASGIFSGSLVEGESFTRHLVSINDNALDIFLEKPSDIVVNGVQLTLIPSPATAAILGASMLLVGRRRREAVSLFAE